MTKKYDLLQDLQCVVLGTLMFAIPIFHWIVVRTMSTWGLTNTHIAILIYIFAFICLILMLSTLFLCKDEIIYKFGREDWLICIMVVFYFISYFNSLNKSISLLGCGGRDEGILMLLSYTVFFMSTRIFDEKHKVRTINIFLIMLLIHSLYTFVDYFGWIPAIQDNAVTGTITGLAGNPDFMASLLVMGAGLCAGRFYVSTTLKERIIYMAFLGLILIEVLMSRIMAGYWGIFAMVVVFFIYIIMTRKKVREDDTKVAILKSHNMLMFVLAFGTLGVVLLNHKMNNAIVRELGSVFSELGTIIKTGKIEDSFGSYRGEIYRGTIKLIKRFPLFGVGIDNLSEPFMELNGLIANESTRADKVHSEILQVAVTMGIPCAITYIAFHASILYSTIKKLVACYWNEINDNLEPIYFGLLLAIWGYIAQSIFNISVIDVAPYFWILLGIASTSPISILELGQEKPKDVITYITPDGKMVTMKRVEKEAK